MRGRDPRAGAPAAPALSVVLVRETPAPTAGGGCVGAVFADRSVAPRADPFAERRRRMAAMARLEDAVADAFGAGVEVTAIDPRQPWILAAKLIGDAWRHRVPAGAALADLGRVSATAVIVNGRLVARAEVPAPERFVADLAAWRARAEPPRRLELRRRWREAGDLLREFYTAPYRGAVARARRDEDDLLMLMIYAEAMGVPNPAQFHTLELQPLLLDRFHEWHTRMGMDHSPLDHFRCC